MGASVTPLRGTDAIIWTVKFRNGQLKRFKFPIRTTPWGTIEPFDGMADPSAAPTQGPPPGRRAHLAPRRHPARAGLKPAAPTARGSPLEQPSTEVVECDLLIVGGGMAGCGAAFEAAYWAQAQGKRVVMVEKGAVERSGAVAMGLSAINCYMGMQWGENQPEDFVRYVRNDLMGLSREDLVYDIARHVDSTVHLFEQWGLPIVKTEDGRYKREGRWQILIHGESYKPIVAEAAKKAHRRGERLRAYLHRPTAPRCQRPQPHRRRRRLQRPRAQALPLQSQGRDPAPPAAPPASGAPTPSARAWAASGTPPGTPAPSTAS